MSEQFVYTIYTNATPERVWRALAEPAFTKQYWGIAMESDWRAGSTYDVVLEESGVRVSDPGQVILESEPPHRLVYAWHTFTPEWATTYDIPEELRVRYAAELRSRVAFVIEPADGAVKLTVTHDQFEPGSAVLAGISQGWSATLSALKSLLESPADSTL
jgi:uncharacterized protein YndB with AHSA1/START domain